jgi:hypothetical protein
MADKYSTEAHERLELRKRLGELAASTDPLVAEHAAWAWSRFAASE